MKPRVAILDDHALFSVALGKLLESDFHVVASHSDVHAFLEEIPRLDPHVVILDVMMPAINGLEAARQIAALVPKARLIFMTASDDPAVAAAAFAAGAWAFLSKRSAGSELPLAIREVLRGRRYLTPILAFDSIGLPAPGPPDKSPRPQLTARQREVLQLLAGGRSMKEAAGILNVSVRTVAFHKYRIMKQLGIESSAALIQFAIREHIV